MARVKLRFGVTARNRLISRVGIRLILSLARESENLAIYWLNWLGSFEGARLCELAEADTRDIVMRDGIWIIGIKKSDSDSRARREDDPITQRFATAPARRQAAVFRLRRIRQGQIRRGTAFSAIQS